MIGVWCWSFQEQKWTKAQEANSLSHFYRPEKPKTLSVTVLQSAITLIGGWFTLPNTHVYYTASNSSRSSSSSWFLVQCIPKLVPPLLFFDCSKLNHWTTGSQLEEQSISIANRKWPPIFQAIVEVHHLLFVLARFKQCRSSSSSPITHSI